MGPDALRDWLAAQKAVRELIERLLDLIARGVRL